MERIASLAAGALVVAAVGAGGTAAAAALAALTPAPAAAEPIGDCSTTLGVIVVVDFVHFGGDVERGCGADPSKGSTTGLQAMHTAGFVTNGTDEYGTRFICRITDTVTRVAEPTPTQTPCTSTPPASAYWSYWHADAGQATWTPSQLGVATYRPPPGSVTLWVFGGTSVTGGSGTGRPPATLTPTVLRASNVSPGGGTTTTTAPPAASTTAPPPGGPPGGGTATTTTAPAGGGGGSSPATTSPPAVTGSTTTTAPAAKRGGAPSAGNGAQDISGGNGGPTGDHRARAGPKIVDVDQGRARAKTSSGSPLPLVVGAIVVVALAGTAGVVTRRRRRAGETG